ncbi:molybdate ABC transporter substrate-binding protein [Arthrobacter sp. EPSL27]|jgi:molybdate transport system substrate-binding protein|uniref:molybdate ABC transporter substrate-binding protein n=1 Tax=Arthrobacter sp. EPSL27 TaxID=1745378 RepID=UPI0007498F8A|nr:molybdate ABC transporter substrate-binding protein [Arthrobacter sp. EPSL27]KUM33686.1 molybdate-binding protein [Arthrobacter sp. EPSL27]
MSPVRKASALLLAAALPLALAGCGGASGGGAAGGGTTVSVFAAASLKAPFTQLAEQFEADNPGTTVTLSFAGSSDLATQISQGAPADVFASADTKNMAKLGDAGLVEGSPRAFATNVLTIVVPPANPASIGSFADLANPGVKTVICAAQVPCGAAAKTLEQGTGTTLQPVSEESSVTDVLGKVVSGEADAGLVYVTDAKAAGDKVREIRFPEAAEAVNTYPIAAVRTSKNKDAAAAFIAAVTGSEGQQVLRGAGFGTP